MTVFIGGNSHVTALKLGAEADQNYADGFNFANFGSAKNTMKRFSAISGGRAVFTVEQSKNGLKRFTGKNFFDNVDDWAVCVGNFTQFMMRDPIWGNASPSEFIDRSRRPFSKQLVDEIVLGHSRWIQNFIMDLKNTGVNTLFVFPPPIRQDQALAPDVPEDVVIYLNKLSTDKMVNWLTENGIDYLLPPAEALNENGLLRPEYSKKFNEDGTKDVYHATPEYGTLMMAKLSDWQSVCQKQGRRAPS